MSEAKVKKVKPDIRKITRLVPPEGNLVQGQSDLPIDPQLAKEAADIIAASENHYGGSEGDTDLRAAVAQKLKKYNGIEVDIEKKPFELLITTGGTGALIGIAQSYLRGKSALVFEPYYPYHRKIIEQYGGKTEVLQQDDDLTFNPEHFKMHCRQLKDRNEFPLKMIIVCTPSNPTGKVLEMPELEVIAEIAKELDLLVVSDEVYEHYVMGDSPHTPIATLPDMWERTITVNSFSKSWNISGWRLGYCYGSGDLIAEVNKAINVAYVCPVTPLQAALSRVLMARPDYYDNLREKFRKKRDFVTEELSQLGFDTYDSGSGFYLWTRIPEGNKDAIKFNEMLMKNAQVAGTPGAAFADSDKWDAHMRICVAREDNILEEAVSRIKKAIK